MTGQAASLIPDATTNISVFAIAARRGTRSPPPHGGTARPEPARRLPRPTQPPGHRRRETRVAIRLRAVEQAYRTATEHHTASRPPEPTRTFRSPEHQADRDRA